MRFARGLESVFSWGAASIVVVACVALERPARADLEFELDLTSGAGVAVNEGLATGVYARPDVDFFLFNHTGGAVQPMLGYAIGLEWWGAPGAFGFGMPALFKAGVRFGPHAGLLGVATVIRVGGGFSVFQVDTVKDPNLDPPHARPPETGGGIYTPTISFDIGIGNASFRLGVEARASYRWAWNLEDRPQVQLGMSVSFPILVGGRERSGELD